MLWCKTKTRGGPWLTSSPISVIRIYFMGELGARMSSREECGGGCQSRWPPIASVRSGAVTMPSLDSRQVGLGQVRSLENQRASKRGRFAASEAFGVGVMLG